eukprot:TRINITY_DN11894_c0_g1_i1.p1 TRINITY_DN11894_c0_g1~~TRINITY_DN11894_c0_g1_i1.p1  ORF type:complete len:276 (+),score=40.09 TRINITY_DN11894_c0_g1_i1:61-888(+)
MNRLFLMSLLVVGSSALKTGMVDGRLAYFANSDCVIETDEGKLDLESLPTTPTDMVEDNFNQLTLFTWVNSWCRKEQLLPGGSNAGAAPCDAAKQPSYCVKYAATYCDYSCTEITTPFYASKIEGNWVVGYTVTQPAEGWVARIDSKVTVECNPNSKEIDCIIEDAAKGVCEVKKEEVNGAFIYNLKYKSPLVCIGGGGGGGSSGGCNAGCAFLIIFFVGGFVYFAAGMTYNYMRKQLRGVEMVPNLGFWKDLPYLIKDGALFGVEKIKGLTNRG